ncbi:hypothetical protein LCL89_14890 [Halobacillus yeomjeoni]|uniref:DUF6933 domain-containing protein n=1 Tax=Halobacillus yeomjeoni TaxID=311194 RepID=A0A931HW14_9BACI|nr:hypothetical protein [Halobacillus yeomjeoni]MBH0230433.1 hypothetical protein [Halobacillus yeomjeoni]MCA0985318.1 hypothetical protein [Halobacillus yeomjeoni]
MFVIGATKKLQDKLDKTIESTDDYEHIPALYRWHANLIKVNKRNCLILMNDETGLNLTLLGLKKQQFENLDDVIKGSLKQLLQVLKVDEAIINQMLSEADPIVYTKTSSRQILGMLNEIKYSIEIKTEDQAYEDIDAVELNEFNNNHIFNPLKQSTPIKTFIKHFEKE